MEDRSSLSGVVSQVSCAYGASVNRQSALCVPVMESMSRVGADVAAAAVGRGQRRFRRVAELLAVTGSEDLARVENAQRVEDILDATVHPQRHRTKLPRQPFRRGAAHLRATPRQRATLSSRASTTTSAVPPPLPEGGAPFQTATSSVGVVEKGSVRGLVRLWVQLSPLPRGFADFKRYTADQLGKEDQQRPAEAMREAGKQHSLQKTLPGLSMPSGSNTSLMPRCISTPTGPSSRASHSFFSTPDAVLAGDRAAELQAERHDLVEGLAGPPRLVGVVRRRSRPSGGCCRRRRGRTTPMVRSYFSAIAARRRRASRRAGSAARTRRRSSWCP